MHKIWSIAYSTAFVLASCSNEPKNIETNAIDYHSLIDSTANKYLEELHADSIGVYIFDINQNELAYTANYRLEQHQLKYRATEINEKFEPASLLKPYWAGVMIQNDLVRSADTIAYQPQIFFYDVKMIDPFDMGRQSISLSEAVQLSSNTAMATFLNQLDGNPIIESELAKMQNPIYRSGVSLAWAAIGSGVEIGVSELLKYYAQVATIQKSDQWSESTLKEMNSMLRSVVTSGTAKNLHTDSFPISGKTATYRKYTDTGYDKYEGRFIGYHSIDPKQIVLVRVFNPKPLFYGSTTAGPIAYNILKLLSTN